MSHRTGEAGAGFAVVAGEVRNQTRPSAASVSETYPPANVMTGLGADITDRGGEIRSAIGMPRELLNRAGPQA